MEKEKGLLFPISFFPFSLFPFPPSSFPFPSSIFLFLFVVQLVLAGCTTLSNLPHFPTPTPTSTPQPAPTPTPLPTATPTATPTPMPTPTPAVVVLKTPVPRDLTAPEPTPAGDLIAYTQHLDFYAQQEDYWAQRIGDLGPAIEGELRRVAGRLQTDLPDGRIAISIQDPSTSPHVRGMSCPARGLYYGETDGSPLLAIFADESTSRVQVLAVAAHELAHHLTFAKFGEGGDVLLSEGLANWASRDTWSLWQGWPSFDAAVRDSRLRGTYLPLEETLSFDPNMARQLGLSDCFALRDLRYNEWSSLVDYLISRYGLELIAELWQATPDDRRFSPRDHVPTVDYAGVLGRTLQQLEQDWLESLYYTRAHRILRNTQYAIRSNSR
ncbi:MAG: hypothetical protein ACE5LU_03390 [Anaerolineae bacterium]